MKSAREKCMKRRISKQNIENKMDGNDESMKKKKLQNA